MVKKSGKRRVNYTGLSIQILLQTGKILLIVLLLFFLAFGAYKAYTFGFQTMLDRPLRPNTEWTVDFTVREGESAYSIGKRLQSEGIIRNAKRFAAMAAFYRYELEPGTYPVSPSTSMHDLLKQFRLKK